MVVSLENLVQEFFMKLAVDFSELSITQEAEHIYRISLKSTDSALLI